jgi:hypothetical protein
MNHDSLCLEAIEFFLLLADGSLQIKVRAVVAVLVELQGRIVELQEQATVTRHTLSSMAAACFLSTKPDY